MLYYISIGVLLYILPDDEGVSAVGSKKVKTAYLTAAVICAAALVFLLTVGILLRNSVLSSSSKVSESGMSFGAVLFSEMMLSNDCSFPDPEGRYYDYVEFSNTTELSIDLTGWYVSDNTGADPWYFPSGTVIDPHGYLVVFFSGDTREGLYCPMKLSKYGREVYVLYASNGIIVDRVITAETEKNLVYERTGAGSWKKNGEPSPLYPNTDQGKELFKSSRVRLNDPVKITEIAAQNLFYAVDADGEYSDYIEITNFGNTEVDLKGYTVSNNEHDSYKWVFPSVKLGAGKSIVVFASGKNRISSELHLSFRLAADGDSLFLRDQNNVLIDMVSYESLEKGTVLIRKDRESGFETVRTPSPGDIDLDKYSIDNDSGKELLINEVMAVNDTYVKQNGEYFDWIEIKNNSQRPILLSEYYITKNKNVPDRWQFPAVTIEPGEYILLFASGSTEKSTQTFIHTNFKIDSVYDELYLYRATDNGYLLCDGAVVTEVPYGMSYGRSPSRGGFVYIPNPTPGQDNEEGLRYISSSPVPSSEGGIYNGVKTISVGFEGEGTVYYTLDGSVPNENCFKYTHPIDISETCVVRAIRIENGKVPSRVVTESYIVNENHTLPVVSVASDPYGLWSKEAGICVRGEPDENGVYPRTANAWQDWERECSVELFDGIWGFSADCGIKLFGQSNRDYPKQSFQLKFRAKYGYPEIYCALFDNVPEITRFENLVLRSGSQDYRRSLFRDELCTSLSSDMDLLVQGYKACILYLNGEYYGIYYIREKVDEKFVAAHTGVSENSIDLLSGNGNVIFGSNDDWYDVLWHVKNYDMSVPSNYNYVTRRVDVESFADFVIAQAFFGNRDSGNIKFYRSSETDNKWRWILFDLDYGMTEDYQYSLWFMIDPSGTGYAHRYSTALINGLLKNSEFFDMFMRRTAFHLDNTFSADVVLSRVSEFRTLLIGEIERNIEKWGKSYNSWTWQTTVLKNFVTDRNDSGKTRKEQLVSEIRRLFSLTDTAVEYYFYMTDEQRSEFDVAAELGLIENVDDIFSYVCPVPDKTGENVSDETDMSDPELFKNEPLENEVETDL